MFCAGRLAAAAVFLVLFLTGAVYCGFAQENSYESGSFNAGLRVVDSEYVRADGAEETVTAAIWYPAKQEAETHVYHSESDYTSRVAVDAPLSGEQAPYLLIIYVHGAYGSGYNIAFFAEYLARRSYIVIWAPIM